MAMPAIATPSITLYEIDGRDVTLYIAPPINTDGCTHQYELSMDAFVTVHSTQTTTETSCLFDGLVPSSQAWARVKSLKHSVESSYSSVITFMTEEQPEPSIYGITPSYTSAAITHTLLPDEKYEIEVDLVNGEWGSSATYHTTNADYIAGAYTIPQISPNTKYMVRVRYTVNPSQWSLVQSFATPALPAPEIRRLVITSGSGSILFVANIDVKPNITISTGWIRFSSKQDFSEYDELAFTVLTGVEFNLNNYDQVSIYIKACYQTYGHWSSESAVTKINPVSKYSTPVILAHIPTTENISVKNYRFTGAVYRVRITGIEIDATYDITDINYNEHGYFILPDNPLRPGYKYTVSISAYIDGSTTEEASKSFSTEFIGTPEIVRQVLLTSDAASYMVYYGGGVGDEKIRVRLYRGVTLVGTVILEYPDTTASFTELISSVSYVMDARSFKEYGDDIVYSKHATTVEFTTYYANNRRG
ncbi:MAG: hypothetical protein Q8M92_09700, partial [Candidatus Subteraquimicrobiales bacterium]|nr:hypothetical protein [Candidatus Subteraquimicrobiales bacterium]